MQRKAAIERMQRRRAACLDDAVFLALLGALLLDDGDPAQALVWLERSLMLDPGNLGARADHALALADLGLPEALRELSAALAHRSDLPEALRDRLYPAERRRSYALRGSRLGGPAPPRQGMLAELTLTSGYETNLDRAPRLTELTLTFPDGPVVLPVTSVPRSGAALLGLASVQGAYAATQGTVLRSGLSLLARGAPAHNETDWHQLQWASQAELQASGWRGLMEFAISWVGGPLVEPYRLQRWSLAGERYFGNCRARVAIETEDRNQELTLNLNSQTSAWLASWQCPLPLLPGWRWSLAHRHGDDRPESMDRPGGRQALRANGLRLEGRLGRSTRLDASLSLSSLHDSTGYSPLLDDNAVRQLQLRQFWIEVAHRLGDMGPAQTEALLQWQDSRQRSNLGPFAYRAASVYGGLRWTW